MRKRLLAMRHMGGFLWLVIPALLIVVFLIFGPLISAAALSFLRLETIVTPPTFAGLENYVRVLRSGEFWNAFVNGLVYSLATIFFQITLGLLFGVILNESFRGRGFLRGAVIVPYVTPAVAGVFLWRWMLDENVGLINAGVEALGFDIGWLSDPHWAMVTIVFISVWLWTPFVTISVLAGLQTIPQQLYEAAQVDGASTLRRFWHVTLPGLLPVLMVVALLRGIWMFNKFDVIWLTTGGGPLDATEHLPILTYKLAFGAFDLSGGATVATLNMLFIMAGVVIYLRFTRTWTSG